MRYIEAPNPYVKTGNDVPLFLAGGITNCPDWQKAIVELLKEALIENLVVLNPRRENFPIHDPDASYRQIKWEWDMFKEADLILFWFARGSVNPIVLFEYGKWMTQKDKAIFVGCDVEYPRLRDVNIQTELERPDTKIVHQLQELVNQVKEHIKKRMENKIVYELDGDMLQRMRSRRDGQRKWLKEKFPQMFEEQAHCVGGTIERYYWHYGYMIALDDMLERWFKPKQETTEDDEKGK